MSTQDIDEVKHVLWRLFGRNIGLDVIHQQVQSGVRIVVGNISFKRTRQTAVVFRSADLHVPQIAMTCRADDCFETVFGSLKGFEEVVFENSPVFAANYLLQTQAEAPTRVMFTKELRDFFSRNPGWSIRGHGFNLVVFRDNLVCNNEFESDDLISQSLEVLSQLREGEKELDARPGLRREASPAKLAEVAVPGGVIGALLRSARTQTLTREELEHFESGFAPRRIPRGLRAQVLGSGVPFIILGVVLFLVGTAAAAIIVSSATGFTRLVGVPFLVFTGAGLQILRKAVPARWRGLRLMKNGRHTEATVTQVCRSEKSVDGFDVVLSFDANGKQQTAKCWISDAAGRSAYSLQRSGDAARILVDPKDASHVLCLDFVSTTD